jgi:hypothetical protein
MPRSSEGLTTQSTWDALGMRATQSDDTVLAIFAWAEPMFGHICYGIAPRAFDWTVENVKKKTSLAMSRPMAYHAEVQHSIAEMALELEAIGPHLEKVAQDYLPSHLTEKILANRGRLEGERKLVTVLFADLVGDTALSEQLGEAILFAVMDKLYEAFIHEVHRYEGTVNELTGDGLVAFFGAPLAAEQAPQRAVHAPLALQQTAARFNARLAGERNAHLKLRVGINTGPPAHVWFTQTGVSSRN